MPPPRSRWRTAIGLPVSVSIPRHAVQNCRPRASSQPSQVPSAAAGVGISQKTNPHPGRWFRAGIETGRICRLDFAGIVMVPSPVPNRFWGQVTEVMAFRTLQNHPLVCMEERGPRRCRRCPEAADSAKPRRRRMRRGRGESSAARSRRRTILIPPMVRPKSGSKSESLVTSRSAPASAAVARIGMSLAGSLPPDGSEPKASGTHSGRRANPPCPGQSP